MKNWKRTDSLDEIFEKRADNGVVYLYFKALEETALVKHGFSTRIGGVSKGVYSSMNLSFSKPGDSRENVLENYARMAEAIGVEKKSFVLSHQTHTDNILKVEKKDIGKGIYKERDFSDIDALITNENNITLVTLFADCIPIFLLDTKNKAIALIHSGWRGTLKHISEKTIKKMTLEYGTDSKDIIACIGPGICMDCYEVGNEVYLEFKNKFIYDINNIFKKSKLKPGHYHLNLWEANKIILQNSGVSPQNIHISNICTHCNHELLYSHRRHGEDRGNLAAFLALI